MRESNSAGDAFNWNNIANNTSVDLGPDSGMNAANPICMKQSKNQQEFFGKQGNGGMKQMQQQQQLGMQQNMMPGAMNTLKSMQDQGAISSSVSAANLLQNDMGMVGNNPGQPDSAHVTPFLRPTNPSNNFNGLMNTNNLN